jgi:hypothetical protein
MSERQRFGNSTALDFLVSRAANHTQAVGPLIWQPSDGSSCKYWYFWVGSCDATGEFHADRMVVPDGESEHRRLALERWCEALWPGGKICRQLERERGKQT